MLAHFQQVNAPLFFLTVDGALPLRTTTSGSELASSFNSGSSIFCIWAHMPCSNTSEWRQSIAKHQLGIRTVPQQSTVNQLSMLHTVLYQRHPAAASEGVNWTSKVYAPDIYVPAPYTGASRSLHLTTKVHSLYP